MAFWVYDIVFLLVFILIVSIFIYKNRKRVGRELGIMFLYRTQLGVRILDNIAKKNRKILGIMRYAIVFFGYLLMISILYLIGKSIYDYVTQPLITEVIKSPPIVLLIPYFPTIFGLRSFLPPFYFTYFILAVAIVLVVHEGFHGIFMRYSEVKIKSTGLAFLGPILGAFVEQDEKDMVKASKFNQMSILAAGVFANLIVGLIFLFVWWSLFSVTFTPSGALFNTYLVNPVNVSSITSIGGMNITESTNQELINFIDKSFELKEQEYLGYLTEDLHEIRAGERKYFMKLEVLKAQLALNQSQVFLYGDYPAVNAGLRGVIIQIDERNIETHTELSEALENYRPGDTIKLITDYKEEKLEFDLTLEEHPEDSQRPLIGIGNTGVATTSLDKVFFFKDPYTYYKENNEFLLFLYYLAFWIFLINIAVALFNMLPFAILDGGRFFYLTVLSITKNEKIASRAYKGIGYLILAGLILIMGIWFVRVI
jgi:membrane-associated protease RseP (regulator of RpoE activity)